MKRCRARDTALAKVREVLRAAAEVDIPEKETRDKFINRVTWRVGFSYTELVALEKILKS